MNGIVVVDTNVPLTANGAADASPDCIGACIAVIVGITSDRRRIALDEGWLIIGEYQNKLRSAGQRGLGDGFLKWVLTNRANPLRCELVRIRPRDDGRAFEEFPDRGDLVGFDPADRKFVAVANAHPAKPSILQGVDSKWWGWREALQAAGIAVDFLCEADVRTKYEAKFGR